jgi:hypothetical protein
MTEKIRVGDGRLHQGNGLFVSLIRSLSGSTFATQGASDAVVPGDWDAAVVARADRRALPACRCCRHIRSCRMILRRYSGEHPRHAIALLGELDLELCLHRRSEATMNRSGIASVLCAPGVGIDITLPSAIATISACACFADGERNMNDAPWPGPSVPSGSGWTCTSHQHALRSPRGRWSHRFVSSSTIRLSALSRFSPEHVLAVVRDRVRDDEIRIVRSSRGPPRPGRVHYLLPDEDPVKAFSALLAAPVKAW